MEKAKHRPCNVCKKEKSLSDFYVSGNERNCGVRYTCIECSKKAVSLWAKNNRARCTERKKAEYKRNPQKQRDVKRKYAYGLPEEEYHNMVKEQNNLCAICNTGPENCNAGLGHFKDNIQSLLKAIEYLEKHQTL